MALGEGDVILDIGSGTGNLALAIARHSRDVRYLGFDPDEAATRIARTKTAQIVPPPEFRVGFFAASAIDDWPSPSKIAICLVLHQVGRSEEHTSELQSLMRISYAVFCLKKKKQNTKTDT